VEVSVSAANEAVSLPVVYQLYLPESWARDRARHRGPCVPPEVPFQPKWQIALSQIRHLQSEGLPAAPVVADAGYGDTTEFHDEVR
jgi:SRSO17 transposase